MMDMVAKARRKLGLEDPLPPQVLQMDLPQQTRTDGRPSQADHKASFLVNGSSNVLPSQATYLKSPPNIPLPPLAFRTSERDNKPSNNSHTKKKSSTSANKASKNSTSSSSKPSKEAVADESDYVLKPPPIVSLQVSAKLKQVAKKERYADNTDDTWTAFESEYERKLKEDYQQLKTAFSEKLTQATATYPNRPTDSLKMEVEGNGKVGKDDPAHSPTDSKGSSDMRTAGGEGEEGQGAQGGQDGEEGQQRLSIKDLLAVWAMEDANELLTAFDQMDHSHSDSDSDHPHPNTNPNHNLQVEGEGEDEEEGEQSVFSEEQAYNRLTQLEEEDQGEEEGQDWNENDGESEEEDEEEEERDGTGRDRMTGGREIAKMDPQSSQFDSHCEALMLKLATRLGKG